MKVSFIVPTIGRASLARTLRSIRARPGDEVIVAGHGHVHWVAPPGVHFINIQCQTGNDWGATERHLAMAAATGDYLSFMDDDDVYAAGARDLIDSVRGPSIFRMQYADGLKLWLRPGAIVGNISTQMFVVPNDPARLGRFSTRREGDFDFWISCKWKPEAVWWRNEIIAFIRPLGG
jgi:glycosyltransferase involved in cell wall biosynthesis